MPGRAPKLPDHLDLFVKKLETTGFHGEISIHYVKRDVIPQSENVDPFTPGNEIATVFISNATPEARMDNLGQDMANLEQIAAEFGFSFASVNTRDGIAEGPVDILGTRWRAGVQADKVVSAADNPINSRNSSAKLTYFRDVQQTTAAPKNWLSNRDVSREPVEFTAQFRFKDDKYMLLVRLGASLQAKALRYQNIAKTALQRDRAVKPQILSAALTNVQQGDWKYRDQTRSTLSGLEHGVLKKLEIAVNSRSWDQTVDSLKSIAVDGAELSPVDSAGIASLKTTAGLVELQRVPQEKFAEFDNHVIDLSNTPQHEWGLAG